MSSHEINLELISFKIFGLPEKRDFPSLLVRIFSFHDIRTLPNFLDDPSQRQFHKLEHSRKKLNLSFKEQCMQLNLLG